MFIERPGETVDPSTYNIQELADLGGVTRRTVRYYVQRGLIPPPLGVGRGSHYRAEHLAALQRVRGLQEAGVALDAIPLHGGPAARPTPPPRPSAPAPAPTPAPRPSHWTRVVVADGVELSVQRGTPGAERLPALLDALRRALNTPDPTSPPPPPSLPREEGDAR